MKLFTNVTDSGKTLLVYMQVLIPLKCHNSVTVSCEKLTNDPATF